MYAIDELILQCLILAGRASFRRIAEVVGVSEQTVARRTRDMHADGRARVVVVPSGFAAQRRAWWIRIQCRPDATVALAQSLAERPDVGWVALVSGGGEVTCSSSGPLGSDTDGVLARLPRTGAVLSFTAQALLRSFAASTAEWTMFDEQLDTAQVTHLVASPGRSAATSTTLTEADAPLVAALARDGRAHATALAREVGWPAARVGARLDALFAGGALHVATDFVPEAFGYHATALMYLTVAPGEVVEVATALARHRPAGFVAATTGSANVFAVVTCRTSDDLFAYVTEQVGRLRGVQHVELVPYLRRFKQAATRVSGGRLVLAGA